MTPQDAYATCKQPRQCWGLLCNGLHITHMCSYSRACFRPLSNTEAVLQYTCPHKSLEQQPVLSINVCALLIRSACAPVFLAFCYMSTANIFVLKFIDRRGPVTCSCILHRCDGHMSHVATVMICMFCLQVTFPFTTKPEGAGTERVQSCQGAVFVI